MKTVYKQVGMAALAITLTVLAVMTIVTLFTARVIVTDNKIFSNVKNNTDALEAAQAGLGYAVAYLNANASTVATGLSNCGTATNTYSLPTGTLANNATYVATYGCTATNLSTLQISSLGTSADGSSTRTVTELVNQLSASYAGYALIGQADSGGTGSVRLANSAQVNNNQSGATTTIIGGQTVQLRNSASTSTSTGTPYSCNATATLSSSTPPASTTCQDIAYSNATLNGYSTTEMQTTFLGRLVTDFSALANYTVNCTIGGNKTFRQTTTFISQGCTCTPLCSLSTLANTGIGNNAIVYINMGSNNLTISPTSGGTFNIGGSSTPVIFAINSTGNITIGNGSSSSAMTFYGNVYTNTTDSLSLDGNSGSGGTFNFNGIAFSPSDVQVQGTNGTDIVNGVVIGNQVTVNGNTPIVNYNPAYITNTLGGYYGSALTASGGSGSNSYAIVPGSWRDF